MNDAETIERERQILREIVLGDDEILGIAIEEAKNLLAGQTLTIQPRPPQPLKPRRMLKNAIAQVLKDAGRPMAAPEIKTAVYAIRPSGRTSIASMLAYGARRNLWRRTARGKYEICQESVTKIQRNEKPQ